MTIAMLNTTREAKIVAKNVPTRGLHHALHTVRQVADDIWTQAISDDLTPRQYLVLLTAAQNEGLSQTGLVDRTGIDRSTLADMVRRMQKKGLLQRRRTKEDARAYAVRVTQAGADRLRRALPVAQRVEKAIVEGLTAGEASVLTNLLNKVAQTHETASARS